METSGRARNRLRFMRACMSAVLLLSAGSAVAQNAEPPPQPETAPGKIRQFTNDASELVLSALGMLGVRYKYGGNTPDGGLGCSGLVRYVFKEAWNKDLPRTSHEISLVGAHVDRKDLQPGDLVFYRTLKRGFSHVGIYLGDNKFIHAPSRGEEVRIDDMDGTYWKKRFSGARRIEDSNPE
jgi:cell wall-associated NlpC family hydrolase